MVSPLSASIFTRYAARREGHTNVAIALTHRICLKEAIANLD
jgi:hypothetical protein